MRSVPRLLLLTRTPPGFAGVGGVFLTDLWDAYPPGEIRCFVVARTRAHLPDAEILGPDFGWAFAPRTDVIRHLGPLRPFVGPALRGWSKVASLPLLTRRIVRFASARSIDAVWAILNDPATIAVAAPVAERLGVPLLPTVWDPPEALADKAELDVPDRGELSRDFERTLRLSERCGVASDNMAKEYRTRYGIEPVVLIHGVAPALCRPPASEPVDSNELILGFAGSLYAHTEWRALLSALDASGWTVAGRRVRIRILGHGADLFNGWRERVELLGWRPVGEVLRLLSDTDVLYLPYWLDPSHATATRLCFPNKLTTYLASGRPVLFHGPRDSSPAEFLARFPAGVACHSNRAEDIVGALRRLVEDPEAYRAATRAGERALQQELGREIFLQRFAQLVGIPETSLVSSQTQPH